MFQSSTTKKCNDYIIKKLDLKIDIREWFQEAHEFVKTKDKEARDKRWKEQKD